MTLETGDVILTGTPAGSSVVLPGDVVEVEVDAPDAAGAPTTGRLVTHITEGTTAFGDFGTKPAVDDLQRVEAWGSEAEHAAAVAAGRATPLEAGSRDGADAPPRPAEPGPLRPAQGRSV